MSWMAWTPPTTVFFIVTASALVIMTLLEIVQPSVDRRGFLPMVTSRGDRFFLTLLLSAFAHVAWLALSDASVLIASALCLIGGFVLMRWG